ncbi:MAG: NAD(P)H-dependent oxidoreductase [Kineosporiaceae bacterium]|nr:NAD(P)H-dependent oxidoreductase [Kineosporiaceae bacterium]MBK7621899.1 NAD(P)H-dependent oxidoreductase [Kineosporiaceae bacterium]MBK8074205.1 NAD(P)H-dependent oxidoreductase [Kineosporiaceae bacterium]
MNVLVLVGSLRPDSLNRRFARAAAAELPPGVEARFFDRLPELPRYDQTLDVHPAPAVVAELREAVLAADALLVVTPEYNGAPSGLIKDAIDWVSRPRGEPAIAGKRTAVLAATMAPRGAVWAREMTARSLTVAGAVVLAETVGLATAHEGLDGDTIVDDTTRAAVTALLADLVEADALVA